MRRWYLREWRGHPLWVWLTIAALIWNYGIFIVMSRAAHAAPPPGSSGIYHAWFAAQKVPDELANTDHPLSCCAEADGHILTDDDWRIADGEYQVRTGPDRWTVFPNKGQGKPGNTVLGQTGNPTGNPVAWWLYQDGNPVPRCLAPGTVT